MSLACICVLPFTIMALPSRMSPPKVMSRGSLRSLMGLRVIGASSLTMSSATSASDIAKHLTLEELKAIAAFYESPVGRKYKESSLAVMREAMPLLVQELQTEMFREVRPGMDTQKVAHEQAMKEYEQKKQRDRE